MWMSCTLAAEPMHDFSDAAFTSFRLGQTTDTEVRTSLGIPFSEEHAQESWSTMLGKPTPPSHAEVVYLTYAYSPGRSTANCVAIKWVSLKFLNGKLFGYNFFSRLRGDRTHTLKSMRVAGLQAGKTTRSAVISLLGAPDRQYLPDPRWLGTEGDVGYMSPQEGGPGTQYNQTLIEFDQDDFMVGQAKTHSLELPGPWLCKPRPNPEVP